MACRGFNVCFVEKHSTKSTKGEEIKSFSAACVLHSPFHCRDFEQDSAMNARSLVSFTGRLQKRANSNFCPQSFLFFFCVFLLNLSYDIIAMGMRGYFANDQHNNPENKLGAGSAATVFGPVDISANTNEIKF